MQIYPLFEQQLRLFFCAQDFYNAQPLQAAQRARNTNHQTSSHVLGGEAAVWSEHIDSYNFECRAWPRAGIIGAKLWGNIQSTDIQISNLSSVSYGASERNSVKLIVSNEVVLSQALHMSYVRFRYHLQQLGLTPSMISIHRQYSNVSDAIYTFEEVISEVEMYHYFVNDTSSIVSRKNGQLKAMNKIMSQCPDIPENIQRPVWTQSTPEFTGVFLNVGEGAQDSFRRRLLKEWLSEQGSRGVSFIGLSELNGWHLVESKFNVKQNFPKIRKFAGDCGFPYSHVMQSSQPYNIGIVSAFPFDIVGEYFPPLFQRGLLHVFFRSFKTHVFIAHLHAHSSTLREKEAEYLADLVTPIVDANISKVIVMGDLNSLMYEDMESHTIWRDIFSDESLAHSSVIQRLRKKFCYPNGNLINYKPISALTHVGLRDTCIDFCGAKSSRDFSEMDDAQYRACYATHCSYSEPTLFNPEVMIR